MHLNYLNIFQNVHLTGGDGEENPTEAGDAADLPGADGFQREAEASGERGRGGLQENDDGQVCRGRPDRADECPETTHEAT